jgi:hypothetical protein
MEERAMEVSKELYEVMRRQKEILHDIVSLDFSHDFTTCVRDGIKRGIESSILFNGVANDAKYQITVLEDEFLFGIWGGKMVSVESMNDLRRLLAYTDGLNRKEMLGVLNDYESGKSL